MLTTCLWLFSPLRQPRSLAPPLTRSVSCTLAGSQAAETMTLPYEFVGTIVHSGQSMAGHYYAYIMDRA